MRTIITTLILASSSVAVAETEIEFPPESARRPTVATATEADAETPPGTPAAPPADPPAQVADAAAPLTLKAKAMWLQPFGAIAGGMHLQSLHQAPEAQTSGQNPTVAVSRLGLRGGVGEYITFASEFEASLGGPMGYGSSVWEGQAAIAIRDQYVRYTRAGFSFAAGRVADPASFDYVSKNLGDLLYTDLYTRDPLLYSGADRGTGLFGSYDITKYLTVAGTFHSTNPTGITGTLAIGGKLQPFDRPFYLAAAQVGNSQNNLPDQNLHIYFGSPAVMFHTEQFEAKAEVQIYPFSAGADLDITKHAGVGASYAVVDTREPDQHVREHYLNLGTSYWIEDSVAVSLRGSIFAQQISGETMTTGARSLFLTARLMLN